MIGRHSLHARPPSRGLVAQLAAECAAADRLLGAEHPLAESLRSFRTATEQLLTATVAAAAGAGLVLGGAPVGAPVIIGAVLVGLWVGGRLALLAEQRRDICREMIIERRAPRALASVEREWERVDDPDNRARLADSLERVARLAASTSAGPPTSRPYFSARLVGKMAPELREIAALVRSGTSGVAGVALVERLVSSPGSPLYGEAERVLRDELARVRSRLLNPC